MSNQKLSLKIQEGEKVKRLLEKEYENLNDLHEVIQASFKNLKPSTYVLKYKDNEDDWLYIFDDSDLLALKEYYIEKNIKSVKLVIESQQDLAESVVEPKRFNQSQIKDSCVAEVDAFLDIQKKEDDAMGLEVIDSVPEEESKDFEQIDDSVDQLNEKLENTNLVESQPEIVNEEMSIEPVVIDEPLMSYQASDFVAEEEVIDTSSKAEEEQKQEQPQEELKPFNIMDLLQNVQNALNKNENDFKPKDVFHAAKDAIKGTTAEKNVAKTCKKFKEGKGFFFKKVMMGLMNGKFCQNSNQNDTGSDIVHKGVCCDGCNKSPVSGVRYKCSECPDFDLCQDCEAKDMHNHHVFLKLKHPMSVDIIYSHRTNDTADTSFAPQHPPHHQPHHPRRGPWGHHGGRGGRGGRCHQNWENNPLMQLAKQFLGGMDNKNSDSESPKRFGRPAGGWAVKRPVITKKPDGPLVGTISGMQVVETTIQNQSPFPYRLRNVKMIEADEGITFQEVETDLTLKKDESQDFCLAVQLPEKAGIYKASFGFFNHKGANQGERLDVVFEVVNA